MLGDVLLITEKHKEAAEQIVNRIIENPIKKAIIGISGESGSGKSELAHVIARNLRSKGILAKILHSDNYYKILPLERTQWRQENGIENVVGYDEYDWKKIYENIDDFIKGKTSSGPCVDLVTEQVDCLTTDYNNIEMLIIDGLYALKTSNLTYKIFIELTYHETKDSQSLRGKELQNQYRARVLEQEHKMVSKLKDKANIIIDKNYKVRFI